jgi:hypothetical protein
MLFLDLIREMSPAAIWIFLATHGMWMKDPIDPEALRVQIDCMTSSRRLNVSHRDYELVYAILSIPIYEMSVEELCSVKMKELPPSPWGIHGKIKRGELLRYCVNLELEVTPLTFYAATLGYHRLGYSHRLAALQCALSRKIGEDLFGDVSNVRTYTSLYDVEEVQEIVGSLVTYLSFVMRYYGEIDVRVVEAEMTTSIIRRPSDPQSLVNNIKSLLQYIVEEYSGLDVEVKKKNNSLLIEFSDPKINSLLQQIQNQLNPLGRLLYLGVLMKKFEEELRGEHIEAILLDFSEQMNPCDVYFLSLLVKHKLDREPSSTWVICTPLTYPVATITSAYAKSLSNLGEVNLALSSREIKEY